LFLGICIGFCRGECTDSCKVRQKLIENDIKELKRNLKIREDQFRQLEFENQVRMYF